MFCSGLRESHEECVQIKGLDSGTMRSLLEYTYTSRAFLTHSNVQGILEAASQFQVKSRSLTVKFKEDNQLLFFAHKNHLAHMQFLIDPKHIISSYNKKALPLDCQ